MKRLDLIYQEPENLDYNLIEDYNQEKENEENWSDIVGMSIYQDNLLQSLSEVWK